MINNDTMEVLELDNGKKISIIDSLTYNNKKYVLIGVLTDDLENFEDNLLVFELNNGEMIEIENQELSNLIINLFFDKINNR